MRRDNLEQLAGEVSPQNARHYALSRGWQRVPGVNGGIALFQRSDAELAQLIVPVQRSAPDYARRIVDLVSTLAEFENRPAEQILRDLLIANADVVRFRLVSPETASGDLSLLEGVRILDGARRSLLAAACSVIEPLPYHPRMSRTEATQLLNACRLLQTEPGSFTFAIACPMHFVEGQGSLFDDAAMPFARRTTTLLMRSLSRLVRAIETDEVASITQAPAADPAISANLCDALLEMKPPDPKSQLVVSVSWASMEQAVADTPHSVVMQPDYFPILEDVYRTLRPSQVPAESLFVGYVDTLNGNPGAEGRMQGEACFVLVHEEEEVIRARSHLGPEEYQKAVKAHGAARIVKFNGILHLGRRVHQITQVQQFEILGPILPSAS